MLPFSTRTKAALCHLAPLSIIGFLIVPFFMPSLEDECPDFVACHARGALFVQGAGLLGLGLSAALGYGSWDAKAGFDHQVFLSFFWIVWMLGAVVFLLGLVYLAMQAWSGSDFDFGPFNRPVYGEQ